MRETKKEKDLVTGRYVKRTYGMWTGLDWPLRVLLSPIYAFGMWLDCVRGESIRYQKLHEEGYEPEYDRPRPQRVCPQCRRPEGQPIEIVFKIE